MTSPTEYQATEEETSAAARAVLKAAFNELANLNESSTLSENVLVTLRAFAAADKTDTECRAALRAAHPNTYINLPINEEHIVCSAYAGVCGDFDLQDVHAYSQAGENLLPLMKAAVLLSHAFNVVTAFDDDQYLSGTWLSEQIMNAYDAAVIRRTKQQKITSE